MRDDLVLVTGAGGFIGSNIVARLHQDGKNVVACDTFSHDESWRYLAPHLIHDLIRPDDLPSWLESNSQRISAIVHMGAISATTETDIGRIVQTNIRLSLDLWSYAAAHDVTYIYASSAATYGDGSAGFVDDDTSAGLARLRPLNPYGWSKHLVDRRIVDDVERGRRVPSKWAGLKFFNVYGPNEGHKGPMRSVIHQLYPTAAQGNTVRLFKSDVDDYPDGGQLRDFVYVKDCCEIVAKMLRASSLAGIFNAGTGVARTFEDLALAVFQAVERPPSIEYIEMPRPLRGRYQYFTQADITKLQDSGLAPRFHTLEEGVVDYVRCHLA